jgi:hypothetical protein
MINISYTLSQLYQRNSQTFWKMQLGNITKELEQMQFWLQGACVISIR